MGRYPSLCVSCFFSSIPCKQTSYIHRLHHSSLATQLATFPSGECYCAKCVFLPPWAGFLPGISQKLVWDTCVYSPRITRCRYTVDVDRVKPLLPRQVLEINSLSVASSTFPEGASDSLCISSSVATCHTVPAWLTTLCALCMLRASAQHRELEVVALALMGTLS